MENSLHDTGTSVTLERLEPLLCHWGMISVASYVIYLSVSEIEK